MIKAIELENMIEDAASKVKEEENHDKMVEYSFEHGKLVGISKCFKDFLDDRQAVIFEEDEVIYLPILMHNVRLKAVVNESGYDEDKEEIYNRFRFFLERAANKDVFSNESNDFYAISNSEMKDEEFSNLNRDIDIPIHIDDVLEQVLFYLPNATVDGICYYVARFNLVELQYIEEELENLRKRKTRSV